MLVVLRIPDYCLTNDQKEKILALPWKIAFGKVAIEEEKLLEVFPYPDFFLPVLEAEEYSGEKEIGPMGPRWAQ